YSLVEINLILPPPTPTNTPPPGPIIFPIIPSLSTSFPSTPKEPTQPKIPPFFMCTQFHPNLITPPIFLTPIPPNPLPQHLPAKTPHIHLTSTHSFIPTLIPSLVSL
ncbi:anion permease, partial [Staphylococcus hominis]|uniref:anion permease n=1 Tax=Staphylococcus hominis TaxID=1290 RepID=UPI0016439316